MTDYGLLKAVTAEPRSTTLEADAAIGDTDLVVDYAGDFNSEDGGTLDLNGARLAYTGITDGDQPDDPDTIHLAAALTVAATAGDTVAVVAGGQILTDYVAHVTMEIGDEVLVPLSVYQVPMWSVGDYDNPVPVEVSDDLKHLEDAPGRTTTITGLDPATMARITGYMGIDYGTDIPAMAEGSTGRSRDHAWDHIDTAISVGVGTTFLVDGSTTKITIVDPGIYAVAWSVYVGSHLTDARTTTSLGLQAAPDWTDNTYNTYLMGGDPDGVSDVGAFVYYLSQAEIDAGHNSISFYVSWQDLDASKLNSNYFEFMVQQVGGAPGPAGPPGPAGEPLIPVISYSDTPPSHLKGASFYTYDTHQLYVNVDGTPSNFEVVGGFPIDFTPNFDTSAMTPPNLGSAGSALGVYQLTGPRMLASFEVILGGSGFDMGSGDWAINLPDYLINGNLPAYLTSLPAFVGHGHIWDPSVGTLEAVTLAAMSVSSAYPYFKVFSNATGLPLSSSTHSFSSGTFLSCSLSYPNG